MLSRSGVTRITGTALAATTLLAASARSADACSMRAPWAIRDTTMIGFIATALGDTLRTGPGPIVPVVALGHSGSGRARQTFGQRVRLDQLGERAARALPAGSGEAVLVPWDFSAECEPVAWSRSARWLEPGEQGLFRARLRARAQWVDDIPTFDLFDPTQQPFPRALERSPFRRAGRALATVTTEQLLQLLDEIPDRRTPPDSLEESELVRRLLADTATARLYPVTEWVREALYAFQSARLRAVRVPVAGTFRLEASLDGGPWRTFFLKTGARATSEDASEDASQDPLVPAVPRGYFVLTSAALSLDALAPDCADAPGRHFAHVDVDWHAPAPVDAVGSWKGGLDTRLFEIAMSADDVRAWRERSRAAMQARFDSLRAAGRLPIDLRYVPNRPLRFVQEPGARMRIEGEISLESLGTWRVRGERLTKETLSCPW